MTWSAVPGRGRSCRARGRDWMHERQPGAGFRIQPDRGRASRQIDPQHPQQGERAFVRGPSRRHPGRRLVPGQQAGRVFDQRPAQERRTLDDVPLEVLQLRIGEAFGGRVAERQQEREVGERRARLGIDSVGALREVEEAGGNVCGRAALDLSAKPAPLVVQAHRGRRPVGHPGRGRRQRRVVERNSDLAVEDETADRRVSRNEVVRACRLRGLSGRRAGRGDQRRQVRLDSGSPAARQIRRERGRIPPRVLLDGSAILPERVECDDREHDDRRHDQEHLPQEAGVAAASHRPARAEHRPEDSMGAGWRRRRLAARGASNHSGSGHRGDSP